MIDGTKPLIDCELLLKCRTWNFSASDLVLNICLTNLIKYRFHLKLLQRVWVLLNSFLYFDSSVFCGTCYSHYLLPIFLKSISSHLMYFDILNSLSFSSLLMAQNWSQRSFSSCFLKCLRASLHHLLIVF